MHAGSLQRSAAIVIEGAEGVTVANCTLERNDGNAILVSGRNRNVTISDNEVRWTGDTAIALWGRTDEVTDGGRRGFDGSAGDHPLGTVVARNMVHELGAFEKQSSMVFVAKSCATTIEGNVFFNGPRAGPFAASTTRPPPHRPSPRRSRQASM